MDDQRWRRIQTLYRAALDRPAEQRSSYLAEQVGGDADLRRAVELLLDERASGSVSPDTQPHLVPGTCVGPYALEKLLGSGGMGEVYSARDTRLGRSVALKFFAPSMAASPDALDRFRVEARAISALNHPNVCTIYDIGESGGRPYLVMEMLEGKTLRQRIDDGTFTNDELLATAFPILAALEAAHSLGIVHRDLKPANIFLTHQGIVKILDFGLAKVSAPQSGESWETSLTTPGITLGTASYMSPEQARGNPVDARSDLFSTGVLLYEMATGTLPFQGGSSIGTIEAILGHSPRPPRDLNRALTPEIERVIERALEKDPEARFQSAADMRAELLRARKASESQHAAATGPASMSKSRKGAYAAALLALVGIAVILYYVAPSPRPVTSPSEWVQITDFDDSATAPALSPDGKMVAFFRGGSYFLGRGQVYVKLLPDGESRRLTNDSIPKYNIVFTPDGSRIAYTALDISKLPPAWETWSVSVLGGPSTRLLPNAAGLVWCGDGRLFFSEIEAGTTLHMGIVSSKESRAEERKIYFPAHQRAMAHYSLPSPDLKSLLVVEMDRTGAWQRCRLLPMDGGSAGSQVGPDGACIAAAWSPDGKWMYLNVEMDGSTHLWRQRYPEGTPEQVTFGPTEEEGLAVGKDGNFLITSVGIRKSSVWMHDASGDHSISLEGAATAPQLSADGKRIYYLLRRSTASGSELWFMDIVSGESAPVLPGVAMNQYDISYDGQKVAFSARNSGKSQIYLASTDRSSPPRAVTSDGDSVRFGPNGSLIFRQLGDKANYLARIEVSSGQVQRIWDSPILNLKDVSPDGNYASFSALESNLSSGIPLSVFSVRDHTTSRVCTNSCNPLWSSDGSLFYISSATSMSSGRTLVFSLPGDQGLPRLPAGGLTDAENEEFRATRVVQRGGLAMGPDPDVYAYVKADFQGNLFRIPLH